MDTYRKTIPSVLLQPVLDLPSKLPGQYLEVIVLPVKKTENWFPANHLFPLSVRLKNMLILKYGNTSETLGRGGC